MAETNHEPPHDFRQHTQREALTMALYLAIVLLALMTEAVGVVVETARAVGVIWGTSIGLGLAHLFAFQLAGKRFGAGSLTDQDREVTVGLVIAVAGVAALASLPFIIGLGANARLVSELLLTGLIGVTAYGTARASGAPLGRALVYVAFVLLVDLVVVTVKAALSH
jgi:hypothetical protein